MFFEKAQGGFPLIACHCAGKYFLDIFGESVFAIADEIRSPAANFSRDYYEFEFMVPWENIYLT